MVAKQSLTIQDQLIMESISRVKIIIWALMFDPLCSRKCVMLQNKVGYKMLRMKEVM